MLDSVQQQQTHGEDFKCVRISVQEVFLMRIIVAVILSVSMIGCAPTLSEAGKKVQVAKADPPMGCQELGTVEGLGSEPRVALRNNVAKVGANFVRLEMVADVDEKGTAYRCPETATGSSTEAR
jgi:hypothetical protein